MTYMNLQQGYNGAASRSGTTSPPQPPLRPADGAKIHSYVWQIGKPVLRSDGFNSPKNFHINWEVSADYPAVLKSELDELYRGIASTFAPDIYDDAPAGVVCHEHGHLSRRQANAGDGHGGTRALRNAPRFVLYVLRPADAPRSRPGFTVQSGYLFNIKYAPYLGDSLVPSRSYDPSDADSARTLRRWPGGEPEVLRRTAASAIGDTFQNLLQNWASTSPPEERLRARPIRTPQPRTAGPRRPLARRPELHVRRRRRQPELPAREAGLLPRAHDPLGLDGDVQDPRRLELRDGYAGHHLGHRHARLSDPPNSLSNSFVADVRSFGAILENDSYPDPMSPSNAVPAL